MLKNLLTVAAIGLASFAANADVVWQGSQELDWNNAKYLQIESTYFSSAKAGDYLYVTFDWLGKDANVQICSNGEGWKELSGSKTSTNRNQWGSFDQGTTDTMCELSADDVFQLQEFGLALNGVNLNITSIQLLSEAPEAADSFTWTGSESLGNWDNLIIPASKFGFLKEGMTIEFFFTVGDADTYGKMLLKDGAWGELSDLQKSLTNVNEYDAFEPGVVSASATLSAADAEAINKEGFIITGYNLTMTKIVFNGEGGEDNPGTSTGGNVWTGSEDLGNWLNLIIAPSYTKNIKAGDKITITFSVNAGNDYGNMVFKDGDWKEYASLKESATNKDTYGTWQADVTSTVLTVGDDSAAAIASSGLIISGENVTITKVVFGEDSSSDNPGGNNPGGEETGANVWTGNEDLGNWQNLIIAPSYTKDIKAGDQIAITFSVNAGSDYGNMAFKDGDWKEYTSLKESATNRDEWGTWQAGTTTTVLTVGDDSAAMIAATGFIISGENVTITKVVFGGESSTTPGPTGVETVVDNSNAPVEYFNLQGVRLSEPARGTIVIRRQGTDVKKVVF